ncbi:PLP-dependent aminotransferase family protein [Dyella tabacisoli]|uniref:PLP-dependent aminotransferase family protein n=1 Tax=Dyella tabacisoli TaxID=2282381 RepID=A0A369UN95_9GAMM|nr:PLP-dependent aminotransferase family protein [Dyella tabacisoli]RDD82106.1 PLP-dependent aminotransferase family protein [Dyella tabacisoli]
MAPIFGFPITLPPPGTRERLRALHGQLRAAILDGRLQAGLRLPATRELAEALQVSRNTVVAAYDLLLSEGYVVARRGAGNYVADLLSRRSAGRVLSKHADMQRRLAPYWRESTGPHSPAQQRPFQYDFRVGVPDNRQFPFEVWRRLSARALRDLSKAPPIYGQPEGRPALRDAIARHVSFARAVACHPDDVIVTSGAQQAFDLLARVLVTPGQTTLAVEDPGYPPLRAAFTAAGAKVVAVPVDDEGLVVEQLPASTQVIYVTPSHQFPLGMPLSPRRRAALLAFAQTHNATIIEDDYDGEFRYGGRPLDALQTLDRHGSVCYVGTFSKCLFPTLRLGYLVAPPWLHPALAEAKQHSDWHCDVVAQDTLAAFIAEGHLVRHVRKMSKVYAERREVLLHAMVKYGGGRLQALASDAGLHLAATLPGTVDIDALIARAADGGIRLESLHGYAHGSVAPHGLVFGFGMVDVGGIDGAIRRVMEL